MASTSAVSLSERRLSFSFFLIQNMKKEKKLYEKQLFLTTCSMYTPKLRFHSQSYYIIELLYILWGMIETSGRIYTWIINCSFYFPIEFKPLNLDHWIGGANHVKWYELHPSSVPHTKLPRNQVPLILSSLFFRLLDKDFSTSTTNIHTKIKLPIPTQKKKLNNETALHFLRLFFWNLNKTTILFLYMCTKASCITQAVL